MRGATRTKKFQFFHQLHQQTHRSLGRTKRARLRVRGFLNGEEHLGRNSGFSPPVSPLVTYEALLLAAKIHRSRPKYAVQGFEYATQGSNASDTRQVLSGAGRTHTTRREMYDRGNLNFPQTLPIHIASALRTSVLPRAIPRKDMVDLDLEQILETAGTIVQELLATGEFG